MLRGKSKRQFIPFIYVVVASLSAIPLHRLLADRLLAETISYSYTFVGFFAVLTLLFLLLGNYVAAVSKDHIHIAFIATQAIRMLFSFSMLGYILYAKKPVQTTETAFAFIFWYLIFTIVEINAFLINLRPDFDR